MELTMPPSMLVQSKGRFRERKKLTMVKAQVYWKATKSKKSQMLDDFCESTGTVGDMRPGSCTRQDSGTSWETVFSWLILRSISTDTVYPGMVLLCCRHSSPSGVPAPSWGQSVWLQAWLSSWRTSPLTDISLSMRRSEDSSSR